MDNSLIFWICWALELIALLVIGLDLQRRYARRFDTPVAPGQWKAGWSALSGLLALVVGGPVLRMLDRPEWGFYLVAGPLVLLLAFFLVAAIAILFGARTN